MPYYEMTLEDRILQPKIEIPHKCRYGYEICMSYTIRTQNFKAVLNMDKMKFSSTLLKKIFLLYNFTESSVTFYIIIMNRFSFTSFQCLQKASSASSFEMLSFSPLVLGWSPLERSECNNILLV